jgi:tetratricopeptide (TPR) repeat protein
MKITLSGGAGAALLAVVMTCQGALADYKTAVAAYNQKNYEKAIQELKSDLDQNPDWEFGHRLAGLSYLALKNNALAVSSLSRAVQLKSTTAATYIGLGQAYLNMQRYDNALQALSQGEAFLKGTDDNYRFHRLRAVCHVKMEKYGDAATELAAAIRFQSSDWTDYSQLGIAYYNLGRLDEAIQALQRAAALRPGQQVVSEFLAKCYLKLGAAALASKQYPQALDAFVHSREFNDKDGYVHYNIAEVYVFQKKYPEAERTLQLAATLLPKVPEVYMRLGLVFEKQKKYDQSLAAYRKADELSPSPGIKDAIKRVQEAKKQ